MRKPGFCLSENKGADQLRSNCEADRLRFRFTDSTIPPLPLPKISRFVLLRLYCITAWFVSDRVGNPEDRFPRVSAPLSSVSKE